MLKPCLMRWMASNDVARCDFARPYALGDPALRRHTTATDLNAAILSAQAGLGAGTGAVEPGGQYLPRHSTHFVPSSLAWHGTL